MKARLFWFTLLLLAALLASCDSGARVGALQTETQTVELGEADATRVEIDFGAGNLNLTGGADELLVADFNYNVAKLKPVVDYKDGKLVVRQPSTRGLPVMRDLAGFRNEWDLRLLNDVPMDLNVNMGAGSSVLQLAELKLTDLDVHLGAGESTIDLGGDWTQDLNVSIDSGAAELTVRLPSDVGVQLTVESGPSLVDASGLTKNGNVYTNAAYGEAPVTLHVHMQAGIGRINLEVEETAKK